MNIFVAKLNPETREDALRSLFEEFGEVSSAKVIMDKETGNSKGYGFVEMPNDEDAQAAIDSLNESDFEDRVIVVKKARPKEKSGSGFNRNSRGGGGGGFRPRSNRNKY